MFRKHSFFCGAILFLASSTFAIAGSRPLGDLTPGSAATNGGFGAYLDGYTYFSIGCALWRTDGTPGGTSSIVDVTNALSFCNLLNVTSSGGKLYMTRKTDPNGHEQLWTSDGTALGTVQVNVVAPLFIQSVMQIAAWPGKPGRLLIRGEPGTEGNGLYEYWISDGTPANTTMLYQKDVNSVEGPLSTFSADHKLVIFDDHLWVSDGTAAATMVNTSFTTTTNVLPIVLGSRIIFVGKDATHGYELWSTDLTTVGTQMLNDFTPGPGSSTFSFGPINNGNLFFKEYDYMWRTDGTPAGTIQLTPTGAVVVDLPIAPINNGVMFPGKQPDGHYYWWISDGTVLGTQAAATQPITTDTTNPIEFASGHLNTVVFGLGYGVSNNLLATHGATDDTFILGDWLGVASSIVPIGEFDMVSNASSPLLTRKTKPYAVDFGYPNTPYTKYLYGFYGAATYFTSPINATSGAEPWSLDMPDNDLPACSNPSKPIADGAPAGGRADTIYFPQAMKAGKLRVTLNIPHTFIGDLSATLKHVETSKTITLFNRPGQSAAPPYGCPSNDLNVVLDDAATIAIGTNCSGNSVAQAYAPGTVLSPIQPLSTFKDDDLTGHWTLTVTDNQSNDTGGIDGWCLQNVDRIYYDDFQP